MNYLRAALLGLLLTLIGSSDLVAPSTGFVQTAAANVVVQSGSVVHVQPSEPVDVGSLVFSGVIDEVIDRVDILAEGTVLDVGAGEFAIRIKLRPSETGNDEEPQSTGPQYGFPDSNIFLDRDNTCATRDFGAGLADGQVLFSVENGAGDFQVVGGPDIRDDEWHDVVLQRRASDGAMSLYVDGSLAASGTGPTGTISLPGCVTGHERFIVIGTEKHGFEEIADGFVGSASSLEIYDAFICTGATCSVPSAPANPSTPGLLGQWLMKEGTGTTLEDEVGNNDGTIAAGGVPAWSADSPF